MSYFLTNINMTYKKTSQRKGKASLSALVAGSNISDIAIITSTGASVNTGGVHMTRMGNGFASKDMNVDVATMSNGFASIDANTDLARMGNGFA